MNQTTSHILMIEPVNFAFNAETAVNNSFQQSQEETDIQEKALAEFNDLVKLLRDHGIDVTTIIDTPEPFTPDSIFPNNWISFHEEGTIFLYPMYAPNRRLERKSSTLQTIGEKFDINRTIDLTAYESRDIFLEGTGSMVLDRINKIAYACLSPRTNKKLMKLFCDQTGYKAIVFNAVDETSRPIYHTNVMMCVADQFAVVCLESIPKREEKQRVSNALKNSGKEIIEISLEQMNHFAGNMLQVESRDGEKILVMSSQAFGSLSSKQVKKLESFNKILHSPLTTIETNGGGSARCMMAEVFLPVKTMV